MKPLILIARGVRALRNGNRSAKDYAYWDELITLLKDKYEVQELVEMPLDQLEALIKTSHIVIAADSFMQHFCWSIGKQAIVLWGISDPLIFGHKEHINLLKSRNNLRQDQFNTWEAVPHRPEVFTSPQEVLKSIPCYNK